MHLPEENVTIAEALQAGGYKTIHLGKWHLGDDPCTQGFDVNIGGDTSGGPYGGGKYFSPYGKGAMGKFNSKYPEGTHRCDVFADQAIKFMNANKADAFFMYMSYYSVHAPLQAVPEMVEKYSRKKGVHAPYASMIEKMDESIGKIVVEVDRLGLKEKTMILFTSDNGGICKISSQAPYRAGKGSYFDGGIREPLLVRWPGEVKAGTTCDVPIIGIDFYPTFLAVAGVAPQKNKVLDGVDISPLFRQTGGIADRALYWHFPIYLQRYGGAADDSHDILFRTRPGSAMILGKWKLHEYFEDGRLELYDLENDIGERKNIASEMPEKVKELHSMMKAWRKETNAPVPTELNPKYAQPKKSKKSKKPRK